MRQKSGEFNLIPKFQPREEGVGDEKTINKREDHSCLVRILKVMSSKALRLLEPCLSSSNVL